MLTQSGSRSTRRHQVHQLLPSAYTKEYTSLGLPEVIVSDSAANFTNEELADFLKRNGVRHVRTPVYHPASNGLVKRAVQTFKNGMRKLKEGSVDRKLSHFLFKYRITPQSSTGISPAELMFGHRLRTLFYNMHPEKVRDVQLQQAKRHDVRVKAREFVIGDLVYAQNYRQGPKWLPGVIVEKHESTFTVQLKDGRKATKRTDHLLARATNAEVVDKDPGTPDGNDVLEYPAREDTDQSDTAF